MIYIHRVAIDANCINAWQKLPAMNELEKLHNLGLIELVRTSTLSADFSGAANAQLVKASTYAIIGSSAHWYLTDAPSAEAVPGPVLRESKFDEIYESIFGPDASGKRRGPRLVDRHQQSLRESPSRRRPEFPTDRLNPRQLMSAIPPKATVCCVAAK
jgi:hypothetical protein